MRFVGRNNELSTLVRALPDRRTTGGGPHVWLVAGPAGIGKTRLLRELADIAAAAGIAVAWGQCWDEASAPPYWPWTQAVRSLLKVPAGTDLSGLVLDRPDAVDDDPFALFDATMSVLVTVAAQAPVLIVLDDLHRADPATLQLLRFVAGHLGDASMLVVATYRPDDAAARSDVAAILHTLRAGAREMTLGGLDLDAVAALIGNDDAQGVATVTGGNPLYIQHVIGAVGIDVASGGLGEVLRARLTALDRPALDVLAALAVLGPDADPTAVATLAGTPGRGMEPVVRPLRMMGLVDHDRLRLAHPLVADAVAEVVAADRLAALHLVAVRDGVGEMSAAERAYHLCRAGAAHTAAAADACREAAAVATASLAHADAVAHLTRALELVGTLPDADAVRFAVAFDLAAAVERTSGSVAAEDAYRCAHDLAVATGDPELIATAAARHGIAFYADPGAQQARAADCRDALAEIAAADSVLRARLLANLVAADPTDPDRHHLADEAVAMARRLSEPETLAIALVAQQVADLGPSSLARRLRASREIVALAEACGEPDLAVRGRFLLQNALLEAGDTRQLDAELITQDRSITDIGELRFARHSLWFRCMRATLDGRAREAEELATQCFAISQDLRDPDGFGVYTGQYGVALWLQGRLTELEPVYLDLMRDEPDEPLWPAVVGWIALADGRSDTARGLLGRLPPPAELPQGMHTLLNLFTMADLAARVGSDQLAAEVRDVLLPYADRVVPIAMGAACFGVIARPLGDLAVRLGLVDEAIGHFERAIALTARMGARPWLVDAQLALAEALVATGRGDDPRVGPLVGEASQTAEQFRLQVFAQRLERLAIHRSTSPVVGSRAGTGAPAAPAPARRARVAVLGTFEVRSIDGDIARWTSRKARTLLKILVARRGAPIAREQMMDLLWPDGTPDELSNRLAVAVSTVRRAIDPHRSLPPDAVLRADAGSLQLMPEHLDIDVETFLRLGDAALAAHREDRADALPQLRDALDHHHGDALPDEPYAPWAHTLQSSTSNTYSQLLRAIADRAAHDGDELRVAEMLRRLIDADPYDEPAHLGLIETLHSLGAHGQAQAARARYVERMTELDLDPRGESEGRRRGAGPTDL